METYGGRLASSTRSRAVRNSHGTAANQLLKEEKYLDKMKSSSQKTLGREEERLKKRLEKLEQTKSMTRGHLSQDAVNNDGSLQDRRGRSRHERMSLQIQDGVDILAQSSSAVSTTSARLSGVPLNMVHSRRESMPCPGGSRVSLGERGRARAMSLVPTHDILQKKSVTFAGGAKAKKGQTDNKFPVSVPSIQVSGIDNADSDSSSSLLTPGASHQSADKLVNRMPGLMDKDGPDNIQSLYDMAFRSVEPTDDMESGSSPRLDVGKKQPHPVSSPDLRKRGSLPTSGPSSKASMDLKALKELEELLKDTRLYTTKKYRQLEIGKETSKLRLQKKRMVQLEQILTTLKPTQRKEPPTAKFDPVEVLNCSYLRLSKHNVEALEKMVRDSGRDPGIHAHSDVTNYKLFDGESDQESVAQ